MSHRQCFILPAFQTTLKFVNNTTCSLKHECVVGQNEIQVKMILT